jgi:hypothetical protein
MVPRGVVHNCSVMGLVRVLLMTALCFLARGMGQLAANGDASRNTTCHVHVFGMSIPYEGCS